MKRVIREASAPETLSVKVDIYYIESSDDVVATDIVTISDGKNKFDADALVDYNNFINNVWETLDYYGFQMIRYKESKSFPNTSKYAWIAYISEVDQKDIPLMFKLRVSDHAQVAGPQRRHELKALDRAEAEELKQPPTKKRQRFVVEDIVVNNQRFATYEDALVAIDDMIYAWLERLDVDLSEIVRLWH